MAVTHPYCLLLQCSIRFHMSKYGQVELSRCQNIIYSLNSTGLKAPETVWLSVCLCFESQHLTTADVIVDYPGSMNTVGA